MLVNSAHFVSRDKGSLNVKTRNIIAKIRSILSFDFRG